MRFGEIVRSLRAQERITLREFCLKNGYDPSNWSKMERGELPPPQDAEGLETMALQLGLKKGSQEWTTLFDAAALERGRIPEDLRTDEEIAELLPLFFRTLRGNPHTEEELDRVIKFLRKR
jgi:transcriptional regulator with XRE-family HTH domain